MIEFKGKQEMEPNKFSSEGIENKMANLTFEASYYEDSFKTKLQDKYDKYDQNSEQTESELIDFTEHQHQ